MSCSSAECSAPFATPLRRKIPMKLEHVALNVPDVPKVVAWYVEQLGFRIYRREAVAPFKTFLCSSVGEVMLEFYTNHDAAIPIYSQQNPAVFHLGLLVDDANSERARLAAAGATFVSSTITPDGTTLIMMRDPWGISLQLCQREPAHK